VLFRAEFQANFIILAVVLWLGIMPKPLLRVIPSVVAALPKPG
jgi:NADH:ubiquinone oxidoreductase subunit 4 (subunit M)